MILTTITPYWSRPEMLQLWLKAIATASHPDVEHLVLFCGDDIPSNLSQYRVRFVRCEVPKRGPRPSIGYFHNIGAALAHTPWIMKLDVDAFPNALFFHSLLPVLQHAQPRQWFNAGMFYINKPISESFLTKNQPILKVETYLSIIRRIRMTGASPYRAPAATNFICRREEYLELGGCDLRFKGWGWEDYQQIYMLERHFQGMEPLRGIINKETCLTMCRDQISRPKALQLFECNENLALLHRWHAPNTDPNYRADKIVDENHMVLLDYILKAQHKNHNDAQRPLHH